MATDGVTSFPTPADELTRLRQENELLRAERLQWLEDKKTSVRTIEQLQHQLQALLRRIYGRSAEKVDPQQMQLFETLLNQLVPPTQSPPEPAPEAPRTTKNG